MSLQKLYRGLTLVLTAIPLSLHAQGNGNGGPPGSGGIGQMSVGNGIIVSTTPSVDPNRLTNSGPYGVTFTIQNTNSFAVAVSVSCLTSGPITCANLSWYGGQIAKNGSRQVSVDYSTTSGTGAGGIGIEVYLDVGDPPTSAGWRTVNVFAPGNAVPKPFSFTGNVDRGLCLTLGAGEGGGISCGDLFLVEGMPAYRTLGRDRSLSLYYNSASATGLTLVPIQFHQSPAHAAPTSVEVVLDVASYRDSTTFSMPAKQCNYVGCADSLQVVLGKGLDWSALETGYYEGTVTLRNIYPTVVKDTAVPVSLLVLNRSESEYGRGWSLLGIEQLITPSADTMKRIWVSGDGSMRVYQRGVALTAPMLSQSGLGSFNASAALDGNFMNTAWTTSGSSSGAWLRADLGAPRHVTTLRIYSAAGSSNAKYHVQYSDNGSSWTNAFVDFKPVPGGWREVTWASVGAHRYWRLLLNGTPTSSTSIMEFSFGGVNTFYGAPGDAPDSLVRFTADTMVKWYRRDLKHGASVTFDQTGRHRYTSNRAGHRTVMKWTSVAGKPRLDSIYLPPNDVTTRKYAFTWNATTALLQQIRDPGARIMTTTMSGANLIKVRSPGNLDSTRFIHDTRGVIIRRVAARQPGSTKGDTAATSYTYGNLARVTQVAIQADSAGTAFATTTITPWDERALTTVRLVDTAGPSTLINGPIPGNGDVAELWVDRFGQAKRTKHVALNTVTHIWRDSAQTMPALVTRIARPHPTTPGAQGNIVSLMWNSRGNLVSQRDSSSHLGAIGLPTAAVTYSYGSSSAPDSPNQIVDALGRTATFTYDSLGMTATSVDARGHLTEFVHDTAAPLKGMLVAVIEDSVTTWRGNGSPTARDLRWQFTYDANGNLASDSLPTGVQRLYVADQFGRVTDTYDPLATRSVRTYDALNRVTSVVQYRSAQSVPGGKDLRALCDAYQVICTDPTVPDSSGLPSTLTTSYAYSPTGLDSILDPRNVNRRYRYNARAGARVERDDYGAEAITFAGTAGLVDSVRSRSGTVARFRYDSLGRKRAMIFPLVQYPGQQVPGDSIAYSYDLIGNLVEAKGLASTVRRTYFSNGLLKTEVATGTGYDSLAYGYDAAGARVRFLQRRGGGAAVDSVQYFYHEDTGDLDSMIVRWGDVIAAYQAPRKFTFEWDELGRRRKVTYPSVAGLNVTYRYDAIGQLREVIPSHPSDPPSGQDSDVFDFTLINEEIDAIGRIRTQEMNCDSQDFPGKPCGSDGDFTTVNGYNRMSWLVRQEANSKIGRLRYDASGNLRWRQKDQTATADSFAIEPLHNRLAAIRRTQGSDILFSYTADGSRRQETPSPWTSAERAYYYDGLGRTSGLRTIEQLTGGSYSTHDNPVSCRYDALGRQTIACANLSPMLGYDGNNVIRAQDWSIVHGPGLDDPLVAIVHPYNDDDRELFYVTDGAGRQLAVARANGSIDADFFTVSMWMGWNSAGATSAAQSYDASRQSAATAPGLSFFRNRVYDQASGRWTQEDPIGVAGGVNLYQFNGNNPVAYTDPFGLCPKRSLLRVFVCNAIEATTTLVGSVAGFVAGGGGGLLLSAPSGGIAAPVTVPAGAVAGATLGAATGKLAGEAITNQLFKDRGEKDTGQQYEEIEAAQRRFRQRGEGTRIESIKKSEQRDRQELLDEAEDYLRGRNGE